MKCRFCQSELKVLFIDLFNTPPSNAYLEAQELDMPETSYPLKIFVCEQCFLVQIDEYKKSSEIFDSKYAYFSSYSSSWLKHAQNYVEMITDRLQLHKDSFVIEIASNDGYLLQYFKQHQIPCLGIEPTHSTAQACKEKGIEVLEEFFGLELAAKLPQCDLILGNNVLAHVPDILDFVKGVKAVLKPNASATFEFPHLLNLIKYNQFDTIYHEHFSYLSLLSTLKIFEACGLRIYDVEELPTHGGSLRIYATHTESNLPTSKNVALLLQKEKDFGLDKIKTYMGFEQRIRELKFEFLSFIAKAKMEGKKIVAYGAAAKGNTLLNYYGLKSDSIDFVIDASPHKVGKFMPQSHIPILDKKELERAKPDYVLILPWNLKDEITQQLSYLKHSDTSSASNAKNMRGGGGRMQICSCHSQA